MELTEKERKFLEYQRWWWSPRGQVVSQVCFGGLALVLAAACAVVNVRLPGTSWPLIITTAIAASLLIVIAMRLRHLSKLYYRVIDHALKGEE